MRIGTKLGIASIVLFACAVASLPATDGLPSLAVAFLAVVIGLLAAFRGSRWWLVVPVAAVSVFGVMLYVGFHAV